MVATTAGVLLTVWVLSSQERPKLSIDQLQQVISLKVDLPVQAVGSDLYACRRGDGCLLVSKQAPELKSIRDQYDLIKLILLRQRNEELALKLLPKDALVTLQRLVAEEVGVPTDSATVEADGTLQLLAREFVELGCKETGNFKIIASPDLEQMSPEERAEYIRQKTSKLKIGQRPPEQLQAKSPPRHAFEIRPTNELEKANSWDLAKGCTLRIGIGQTKSGVGMNLLSHVPDALLQAKELYRSELREQSKELRATLNQIDRFRFPFGGSPVPSERTIERYKASLRFNLQQNGYSSQMIDSILTKSGFVSKSAGLLLFVPTKLPDGTITQLTFPVNF